MKGKLGWIVGILETIVGFALFLAAQMEMSSNSRYTWRRPYTQYEAQIIMLRWVGIILLVSGVIWIALKLYKARYTSNHVQEINQVTERGGTVKCPNCGLALSADVANCPKCGAVVKQSVPNVNASGTNAAGVCGKCGNPLRADETYCSKCGQIIFK